MDRQKKWCCVGTVTENREREREREMGLNFEVGFDACTSAW